MHSIQKKPLILYWGMAFFTALVLNILFAIAWNSFFYADIFLILGTIQSPFVYFLFGFLYFRRHEDLRLSRRIQHAFAWMVLTILMGFMLRLWIFQRTMEDLFTQETLLVEGANFVALIVAGFVVHHRRGN